MNLSRLKNQKRVPIVECLPTYRSLAVYFNPLTVSKKQIIDREVLNAVKSSSEAQSSSHKVISIPVCYGGEYGPDINNRWPNIRAYLSKKL